MWVPFSGTPVCNNKWWSLGAAAPHCTEMLLRYLSARRPQLQPSMLRAAPGAPSWSTYGALDSAFLLLTHKGKERNVLSGTLDGYLLVRGLERFGCLHRHWLIRYLAFKHPRQRYMAISRRIGHCDLQWITPKNFFLKKGKIFFYARKNIFWFFGEK